MSIEEQVKEVIIQTFSVKPEEIKPGEKLYDSLSVDSTEIVELKVVLEKKFAVTLEANEITKFSTPEEIVNIIKSKKQ